jgi:hypothetical protein
LASIRRFGLTDALDPAEHQFSPSHIASGQLAGGACTLKEDGFGETFLHAEGVGGDLPQSALPLRQVSMREPWIAGAKKLRTEASPAVDARSRIPRVAAMVLNISGSGFEKTGQEAE